MDQGWLLDFCHKQGWDEPEFWFKKGGREGSDRYPGRPSVKAAILQELEHRFNAAGLEETVVAQSRALSEWAAKTYPGKQTPTPKVVENQIRRIFKELKRTATTADGHALKSKAIAKG